MSSVKTGIYVPPAFRSSPPSPFFPHPNRADLPPRPPRTSTYLPPLHSRPYRSRTSHPPSPPKTSGESMISALDVSHLSNLGAEYGHLGKAETLGSYKWVQEEGGRPTIAVPGVPDVWLGKEDVGKVVKDCDLKGNIEFPDYTSAHVPSGISQHEPLFHSLSSLSTALLHTNLITPRNNLRKIFMFLLPHLSSLPPRTIDLKHRSFRINAHRIPNTSTVLLDRVEPTHSHYPHRAKDWHLAYHESTTARIFKGSDRTPGCIRVAGYDWAGLGVVVRFDVDAFLPDEGDEVVLEEEKEGQGEESIWDELSQLVSDDGFSVVSECGVSVDTTLAESGSTVSGMPTSLSETTITPTSSGINIMRHPYTSPPHENLISIKVRNLDRSGSTQSVRGMNRAHDVYAQLLFARLPMMYLAYHRNGEFIPGVKKVKTGGEAWEEVRREVEATLRGVRAVLAWMVDLTQKYDDGVGFIGSGGRIEAVRLEKGSVLGLSEGVMSRLGADRAKSSRAGEKKSREMSGRLDRVELVDHL